MSNDKKTKNLTVKTFALAMALPNITCAATEQISELATIKSSADASTTFYKKESSSNKRPNSLLNTPRTTQVITSNALKEQNLLSLQEALATTPGITFGAGEAGGGYGDKINLRGYDATNNITTDGLRDTALTTRTDVFNYDAIEVNKGSNSVENGSGQVSGGVNLVTKAPKNHDFNALSIGLGTDNYTRITGDFNKVLENDIAFRLNVMAHKNTYPGRDEELKRWGFAPSLTFGIGENTKATLSYIHQNDNNDPLYGVPYYNGKPVPGISAKNNYGYTDLDNIRAINDTGLLKVSSRISDQLSLHSTTRLSDIHQISTTSAPKGTYCLSNGLAPTAYTNTNTTGYISCSAPGQYIPPAVTSDLVTHRGLRRETETKQIANDTNLKIKISSGAVKNTTVIGGGFSQENYTIQVGNYLRKNDGKQATLPNMDVYNPSHVWNNTTNYVKTSSSTGSLDTYYGYIFNNTKFGSHWILDLGTRYDRINGQYTTYNASGNPSSAKPSEQKNNLLSYNAGLTFKPIENISIYTSYANAKKPTIGTASQPCTATIANNTCNVKPEEAQSYEIGMKWEINPKLLFTVAGFKTKQNKVSVPGSDGQDYILDGKNHVNGVEAGLFGQITPQWQASMSAAWIKGKFDQTKANGIQDFSKGDYLTQVPEYSGSLWTTYQLNDQWQVGYGLTYQGEMYLSQHYKENSQLPQVRSQSYIVHDASITYTFNKDLNIQLIGRNLADKTYYTNIRAGMAKQNNSGFALPGAGRQIVLNINYNF